jgi:hypothetical protein
MREQTFAETDYNEIIVERESIRQRDLDLRKAARALAKKEEARLRKLNGNSKLSAITSAKKRVALLEQEVEKLGEPKAELLGYVGEIANLHSWLKSEEAERIEAQNERDFILFSLLNQRNAPAQEQIQTPKVKAITTSMIVGDIWFVRSFLASILLVGSVALLTYSLYFRSVFASYGSVTSYFPWSWAVSINSAATVTELYSLGVGVSLLVMGFCLVALIFFVPELIRSLTEQSLSEFPKATGVNS